MEINFKKLLYQYLTKIPIPAGCHNLPERSFFYKGNIFPICSRCTGVSIGLVFGYLCLLIYFLLTNFSTISILHIIIFGLAMSIPMGIDWGIQFYFKIISTNLRRFFTGFICGFGVGFTSLNLILLLILNSIYFFKK